MIKDKWKTHAITTVFSDWTYGVTAPELYDKLVGVDDAAMREALHTHDVEVWHMFAQWDIQEAIDFIHELAESGQTTEERAG